MEEHSLLTKFPICDGNPIEAVVDEVLAHHFDGTKVKRSWCISAHRICLGFSRRQLSAD